MRFLSSAAVPRSSELDFGNRNASYYRCSKDDKLEIHVVLHKIHVKSAEKLILRRFDGDCKKVILGLKIVTNWRLLLVPY